MPKSATDPPVESSERYEARVVSDCPVSDPNESPRATIVLPNPTDEDSSPSENAHNELPAELKSDTRPRPPSAPGAPAANTEELSEPAREDPRRSVSPPVASWIRPAEVGGVLVAVTVGVMVG